ncbi:MAG: hypothetical protein HY275_14710 [Gemmatimonadetes bacterium]|nr:hypothetical protein [Gemmatimonadota bacterium]
MRDPDSDWQLVLPTLRQHEGLGARLFGSLDAGPPVVLRDAAALKLMSRLLPHVNAAGAKPADVQGAVSQLERGADLSRLAVMAANTAVPKRIVGKKGKVSHAGLPEVPLQVRLALEMALHEDDERRWLEGELDELTDRWREAEEVAAIADTLLVPGWIEARLGRGDERAP